MRKLRLGILANEFFHAEHGGVGGFGWAARRAVEAFQAAVSPVSEVVLLAGGHFAPQIDALHGCRLRGLPGGRLSNLLRNLPPPVDLILTIDYRPSYDPWLWALPLTPAIVWVRDPRTPADWARLRSLRLPSGAPAGGIAETRTCALAPLVRRSRRIGRRVLLASKMAYLQAKIPGTYGLPAQPHLLCNPDVTDYRAPRGEKSPTPRVAFLGRLDPIKRPWLFVELARSFPGVEFVAMGQRQTRHGGWSAEDVPANLTLLGNVDGGRKSEELAKAWVLVNCSIYEETPVSGFEALAHETPLLSTVDSDAIVARHGVFTGRFEGAGMDALPALAAGLDRLLTQHEWRRELGRQGRAYVERTHNTGRFLEQFGAICEELGLGERVRRTTPDIEPLEAPGLVPTGEAQA